MRRQSFTSSGKFQGRAVARRHADEAHGHRGVVSKAEHVEADTGVLISAEN